jgi:hypothetical protein
MIFDEETKSVLYGIASVFTIVYHDNIDTLGTSVIIVILEKVCYQCALCVCVICSLYVLLSLSTVCVLYWRTLESYAFSLHAHYRPRAGEYCPRATRYAKGEFSYI